jgi:hypothetical protein
MEKEAIKILVQKYFDGDSSLKEEEQLINYFTSPEVDESHLEHKSFFLSIKELSERQKQAHFEDEMNHLILKKEYEEKDNRRWIRMTIRSVAAAFLILLAGFLVFRSQDNSFKDSFDDPQIAYAYAEETLEYMASKYQKGIQPLNQLGKIQEATSSYNKNIGRINNGFSEINRINKYQLKIKYN